MASEQPSDPAGENGSELAQFLYMATLCCPSCGAVSRFVEGFDAPIALDQNAPIGPKYCPECGVDVYSTDFGEWDPVGEHEIETVAPTQERDNDV